MIMSVYGRFFRLYLYTAIAPIPLSSFAGEPSQNIGRSFLKSYAAVCLEGAIVVLACIIFSLFASSPPVVNPDAAAVTMVWSYIGELIFNMLVLVGAVKMSDRVVTGNDGIVKRTPESILINLFYNVCCCCYTAYSPENQNEQNLKESLSVWHEKSGRTYRLS